MIWATRRFAWAECSRYVDRLEKLLRANPSLSRQFIMVSNYDADDHGVSDIYMGLPHESFLAGFDGFDVVPEADLPNEIDSVLIADQDKDDFKNHFTVRPFHLGFP